MEEDAFSQRLRRLEERLAAAKATRVEPRSRGAEKYTQSSLAWRMVIEMVSGMGLGLAIGYGLDALLGTRPALLVIFSLLGFAAGVRTMLRTADEVRTGRAEGALLGRPAGRPGESPQAAAPQGQRDAAVSEESGPAGPRGS
jgi:ATP synthase protein I